MIQGITEARLQSVVSDAAYFYFGDWPEGQGISSSDGNAAVRFVLHDLNIDPEDREIVPTEIFVEIRHMIMAEARQYLS